MAKRLNFSKWHGHGNDFIIIDDRANRFTFSKKLVAQLGDRNFGIGCDQFMVIRNSKKADFKMELYNQDGGKAEMCGNGIRCFAVYLYSRKITRKKLLEIETGAGIIRPKIKSDGTVEVDMGTPILEGRKIPVARDGLIVNQPLKIGAGRFSFTAVSMGNPHAVIFGHTLDEAEFQKYGPAIESHPLFPKRINVEFVHLISRKKVRAKVWERGAGPTLACGTGACAIAVAGVLNGLTDRKVTVVLPGGSLKIEWREDSNRVFMTGPATEVFNGTLKV